MERNRTRVYRVGEAAARHIACGQLIMTLEQIEQVNGCTPQAAVSRLRDQLEDEAVERLPAPEREWYTGVVNQAVGEYLNQYADERRS